jgi:hypothetical protein
MEANPMRAAVKAIDDVSIEPAFYRIPVKVWCDILHYATTSPLFPFSEDPDGHSLLSSLSIIHTPYLFGINWNIFPVSMLYLNYGMYACHQRCITRLRQVCHLWDEISPSPLGTNGHFLAIDGLVTLHHRGQPRKDLS